MVVALPHAAVCDFLQQLLSPGLRQMGRVFWHRQTFGQIFCDGQTLVQAQLERLMVLIAQIHMHTVTKHCCDFYVILQLGDDKYKVLIIILIP